MLSRGEPARGVSLMIPSPQMVEMIGLLGFDWVLLDCEHGTMTPETVELMTIAAEAAGITPVARPRSGAPEAILEVLERGVAGVQIPHVTTGDQARSVVDAVKYHPQGSRSLAARTRPAGYGLQMTLEEYARTANDETLICVQLENRAALANVAEILEVDGVDAVFLGPSDLSQSFGHPGQTEHPTVAAEMERAFATIVKHGKTAGSAGAARRWPYYQSHGVTYLYTHLPAILEAGSQPYLTTERAADVRAQSH